MAADAAAAPAPQPGLIRGLGRWDLVAMVVNTTIGAGIFGLPSRVFAQSAEYSLLAFVLCALLNVLVVLCFAEVSSRFEATGGAYRYACEALGLRAAYGLGWLMWLQRLTSFAAICNLLLAYLAGFWPGASSGWLRAALAAFVTATLTAIVYRGVHQSARANAGFTIGKLLPILAFVAIGLFFLDPARLVPKGPPSLDAITSSALLLVFAFAGFDVAVIPAGEIRDPRRSLPFAMFTGVGGVVLVYVLIQMVCIGTLPGLATSERPLADAAAAFLGPPGATLITIGAVISTSGAMFVTVLAAPRVLYALAMEGQIPRGLGAIHPVHRTPHLAVLVSSGAMLALTVSGSFVYAVTINAMIRLITYVVTCVCMLRMRRMAGAPPALYRVPGGAWVAGVTLLLCLFLLSRSTGAEARDLAIAMAIGWLLLFAHRRWPRRAAGPDPPPRTA
jgi:amino acid transporter